MMWKATLARMMPYAITVAFLAVGFALRYMIGTDACIGPGS